MNANMPPEVKSEIAKRASATRWANMPADRRSEIAKKAAQTRKIRREFIYTAKARTLIDLIRGKAKEHEVSLTHDRIVLVQIQPEPIFVNAKALLDTLLVLGGTVTIQRRRDGLVISQDRLSNRLWTPSKPDYKQTFSIDPFNQFQPVI